MTAEDETLVKACLAGNRQAFDALVSRYEKPIFNAAVRMVNDRDDAIDITQTAFAKAFENLRRFDFRHRFYSWIYRIAINESIDLLGRRKRLEPVDENWSSGDRNPEEAAGGSETARHVQGALMAIQTEQRTIIVLKHYLNCSYREIGEILQISQKTVKSRLFTARQRLREVLSARGVL